MSVFIGLAAIAALFMYMAFALDDKHSFIKVISLVFSILAMLSTAGFILNDPGNCAIVLQNQTVTGNYTAYSYDRLCYDTDNNAGSSLGIFKLINWFMRILFWYFLIFIIYWLFDYWGMNILDTLRGMFNK